METSRISPPGQRRSGPTPWLRLQKRMFVRSGSLHLMLHNRMSSGSSCVLGTQSGHLKHMRDSDPHWRRTQRALARAERALRKARKQPQASWRWRTVQHQLGIAERELRRARIAERRLARSRRSVQQVSPPGNARARSRRRTARDERLSSLRYQQAIGDATKTISTLRGALRQIELNSGKPRRHGLRTVERRRFIASQQRNASRRSSSGGQARRS